MKMQPDGMVRVIESAQFEPSKYCAIVEIVDKSGPRTELRWSNGSKDLSR